MNKKILVIIIVAAFAVSSVGGYLIYDSLYGNHDPSNTNKLAGGYMDISDAVSLSICTVQDSSETNVVSQSVSVDCGQGGNTSAVMLPTGGNISSSCETYKGFHNELHKATDKVADEKVKFYKNQSNLRSKLESDYSDWNIIYLEKCGSVYVMVYTIQDIDGLYDILMMDNCDFWNNDSGHMHFTMVDANTGKVFELTGLWCGSTAWRYEGTNDMISSLQYMGSYNGEEYFKVNVECNKYKAKPVDGTFYNIEGVVAFKTDGENLTHRMVMVDDDAILMEYKGGTNDNWVPIEGKHRKYGFDMKLYENGVIRYFLNDEIQTGSAQGSFTGKDYVRLVNGQSIELEYGWMECSNYLCRNVTYSNQYFPTSMEIYGPNGIEVINDISAEESYRLASTSYYTGCIYREVTENSTVFFILAGDGTVDRLELKKTLVSETTPNYFGEAIPMHNSGKVITSPGQYYNFHIYNNEIFYPGGDWTYGKFSWNTGVMVVGGHLYAVSGLVMKDYNLETGEVREYDIPADAISKTRVDGDGRIYIEASKSESICKLDLGDGGFQVSRTPSQLMTLKKVLANEGQES